MLTAASTIKSRWMPIILKSYRDSKKEPFRCEAVGFGEGESLARKGARFKQGLGARGGALIAALWLFQRLTDPGQGLAAAEGFAQDAAGSGCQGFFPGGGLIQAGEDEDLVIALPGIELFQDVEAA